ncbi:hypothetical protein HPB49_004809 [Dermacentor silvarum]|uniref:Uncharacterized protein n=1 Tax=Dermacentor silvarum TaxID=543639 RepID=A0ACB8DUX7_DERSI|nr:hypothetical protein HPB49_004809 [Dermacentor silvarum]
MDADTPPQQHVLMDTSENGPVTSESSEEPKNDDPWITVKSRKSKWTSSKTPENTSMSTTTQETQHAQPTVAPVHRRLPPLPKDDYKVIFRPQETFTFDRWQTDQIANSIKRASNQPSGTCTQTMIVRIEPQQNIVIASVADRDDAIKLIGFKSLQLGEKEYAVTAYAATPDNSGKGVIHGITPGTSVRTLMEGLYAPGHAVLYARMLGTTHSALITFEGEEVPFVVYYMDGEKRCYLYRSAKQTCASTRREPVCKVWYGQPCARSRVHSNVRPMPGRTPHGCKGLSRKIPESILENSRPKGIAAHHSPATELLSGGNTIQIPVKIPTKVDVPCQAYSSARAAEIDKLAGHSGRGPARGNARRQRRLVSAYQLVTPLCTECSFPCASRVVPSCSRPVMMTPVAESVGCLHQWSMSCGGDNLTGILRRFAVRRSTYVLMDAGTPSRAANKDSFHAEMYISVPENGRGKDLLRDGITSQLTMQVDVSVCSSPRLLCVT